MPSGSIYFNVVFVMVLTSMLIQGWTVRSVARFLRVSVPPYAGPVDQDDIELPGSATQELVGYRIPSAQLGEDGSVTEIGLALEGADPNGEVSSDLSLAGSLFFVGFAAGLGSSGQG